MILKLDTTKEYNHIRPKKKKSQGKERSLGTDSGMDKRLHLKLGPEVGAGDSQDTRHGWNCDVQSKASGKYLLHIFS